MRLRALKTIKLGADMRAWPRAGDEFEVSDARAAHYLDTRQAEPAPAAAAQQPPPAGAAAEAPPLKRGDLVQVEIGGALQLKEPAKVMEITEEDGQTWVRVAKSKAFVPINQIVRV